MTVKSLKKQLVAALAMVLVAAIALGSSTFAWFVSNTEVQANTAKVQASAAGGNLMIKEGYTASDEQTGGKTVASVTADAISLYPASFNSNKWYVVNGWDAETKANAYIEAPGLADTAITDVTGGTYGAWTDGNNTSRNAYLCGTYTVFATEGTYSLYLAPAGEDTQPIRISGGSNHAYDTLRVGIAVNGNMKVVYAPTVDTNVGNDKDAVIGWRMVNDGTSTTYASYDVITGQSGKNINAKGSTLIENDYSAVKNSDNTFKAPEANGVALATGVAKAGVKVQVYVWMEGTDEQCLVGTADASVDTNQYSVTANFVGVKTA